LELRLSELKSVGKVALLTGAGQVTFTSFIGFIICLLLGFSTTTAIYVGIALTFSSTIIIVKLLGDKKDLKSLYGKIAVGMMLVQDFVAVLILIVLSGFASSGGQAPSVIEILIIFLKAIVLFGWIVVISKSIIPFIVSRIARSPEILFLFSLAWAFGLSLLVSSPLIGFSIEIGGFLAGLAMANSRENFQIIAKIRPLRDFFITIFFVTLGMGLFVDNLAQILIPALILAAFVLIGNPLIVMIILGILGYRKRTAFLTGLTVAQISEFSLIVIFMGNKLGHVSDQVVSIATVVGAITFVVSTYFILNGNYLYKKLEAVLSIFERKNIREKRIELGEMKNHIILVGANRMGGGILEALVNQKEKILVVDFNPDLIESVNNNEIATLFGDIADPEIQERAFIAHSKIIISTVPDIEDNLLLLESIKKLNRKPKVIIEAFDKEEAKILYKAGADYVLLPHIAGGHHLAKILVDNKHMELIEEYKKKELPQLS
jgi:Kef-type K+ transport system membrane component KefB/voltage-gated potassium channel Kch